MIVKLEISKDNQFWFLKNIKLVRGSCDSAYIEIASLSDEDKRIIDKSSQFMEIKLFDTFGNRVRKIDDIKIVNCEGNVDLSDIEDYEEDLIPKMICVTDEEVKEKKTLRTSSELDINNAKILVSRNANVIKKIVNSNSIENEDHLVLIKTALDIELKNRNRKNVVEILMEFLKGAKHLWKIQ